MKGLSIEQKAKRYDEALEKSKRLYEQGTITESLCYVFPELKESEDERIRKKLISHFKGLLVESSKQECNDFLNKEFKEYIAWLEKQGNNINCIYDKELSELLHIVICRYINDPDISYPERENVSKKILPYVELLEKQGVQKHTDKVEPKFKVGEIGYENVNIYLETKEQRDLLFQKMKEAGYKWDDEKKELKKIEQKPSWSEEDEKMCQETIDWFEKKCFPYALESENPARESIKWLKELKQRIGG